MKKMRLNSIFNHEQSKAEHIFLSCSIDVFNEVNLLFVNTYDSRTDNLMFFKTQPGQPQDYTLVVPGKEREEIVLAEQNVNYTNAVRVDRDRILFACSRCVYKSANDYEKNVKIFNNDGVLQREFCIGDGVQSIQVNGSKDIWVSYFDEGVFGNYGWKEPIGSSGLNCFDVAGNRIYEYSAPNDDLFIADCYALNVESDDSTWIYFYTEFYLLNIVQKKISQYIKMPVSGSSHFAVHNGNVLLNMGYDERQNFGLFELKDGVRKIETFSFLDEDNEPLSCVHAQGDRLYFWNYNSSALYTVSIIDLM